MEQKKTTDSGTSPLPEPANELCGMELRDYELLAMRTAKDMGSQKMNLIHAAMGMCSDAGEACDVAKAHTIYNKEFDLEHFVEELGDTLWFIVLGARSAGVTLEQVARANILKLQKRYPDKYSDDLAIARLDKIVDDGPGGTAA